MTTYLSVLAGKVSSGGVADAAGALASLRGIPYAGGGNGNGNGHPYVPPALRHNNDKDRGKDKKGLTVKPPATSTGAPGPNLPNLDESRKKGASSTSSTDAPIHADLMCADCDPSGGGGAGGYYPNDPYLGTARTRPMNDTGDPGVDLGSQNFNWDLPVVSLPGRAGLDLSIALYYNSLVWTKQGSVIEYNADHGTPAPGFNVSLPRLQAQFFNSDAGPYSYIMVEPSGGRVEMRQTGTSGVYESADSTYTQLTFSGSTPVVRTTDGTQYIFGTQVTGGSEWRCTQIKDRNGNYISAGYDAPTGHLLTVTDTLGRAVNFHYNADGTLNDIEQSWGGSSHYYAWFSYGTVTVSPNFPGLSVVGVPSGGSQTVLSSVSLTDNESYSFDYNSYGQVYQIRHKAPDGHELEHTRYNIANSDLGAQSDCPRFTASYEYAQDWNNNQEAQTSYAAATDNSWSQVTTPDGTIYKELYYTSGWAKGLSYQTEVWSGGARKKYTTNVWTQDNTSLTFPQNPRVAETNIYDSDGNRKRVTTEYNSGYGLPTAVREWSGSDGLTLQRLTTTDYHLETEYVSRRVIGLPYQKQVFDGPTGALVSKVQYYFDWSSGGDMFVDTPAAATQHDRTNYGPSFLVGRGNLSDIIRYDVNDPNNAGGTTQETKYRVNTTGSVVMVRDHSWHATYSDYGDNFSDGNNSRNTFAYPTTVTDAEGYTSTTQYNFDFGAVTRTHTPTSGTGTGVTYVDVSVQYDNRARATQATNLTDNTYMKWVYDADDNYVHTYQTIQDTTQTLSTKFHSWRILDGGGRVRAQASDHPGSAGGFSGQYIIYDIMGRVAQQSNPTEMTGAWAPAGDDSAWVYTSQTYDWNGRPLQTTNPDGTTKVLSYGGCGCAGGQVTTAQDEHGRQKRSTEDALGRLAKLEEMLWNTGSVYSTTTYAYNARDQLTQINQEGQLRTFAYDGHGRLWQKTTPEQGTMTYAYNADDTVSSMTDARGAKISYGYTPRHLISSISYDLSGVLAGQSVAATSNVSMLYDAAGHRYWMTDGQGWASYHYDSQGRMDWEERNFTNVGTYHTSYGYNLAGELASMTNPWGAQVTYGYDQAGRLSAVGGAGYAGVSTYVSSISYRAFGATKGVAYGDTHSLSTDYDSRLRPTKWLYTGLYGYKYYYDDFNEHTGRVTFAQGITDATAGLSRSQTTSTLDRSYEYDVAGRLAYAHSGTEARAHAFSAQWGVTDGPYSLGFEYDSFGNMTHRYGWGGEVQGGSPAASTDFTYTYANNRRNGFSYDNSGNLTFDGGQHFAYDAEGKQTGVDWTNLQQGYDGDGRRVTRSEDGTNPARYVRSSVFGGQVIAEVDYVGGAWQWWRGYVYANSQLLAVQQGGVFFVHEDPVTKSKRVTNTSGAVQSSVELDPFGADTSFSSNSAFQPKKFTSYERDANGTDEAIFRRYNRWHSRFDQPDPYEGSYDMTNPQSFNRYSYVNNDPANSVDPTGLLLMLDCSFLGRTVINDHHVNVFSCRLIEIPDFDFRPLGGGIEHGGGGGGAPQRRIEAKVRDARYKRLKKDQQKRYDDCASKAVAQFRKDYVLNGGKALAGGALVISGALLYYYGIPTGTEIASGIGIKAAQEYASKGEPGEVLHALEAAGYIAVWPFTAGAKLIGSAVESGDKSQDKLNQELADCAKQNPLANHSGVFSL